jgi:hypothetical protein
MIFPEDRYTLFRIMLSVFGPGESCQVTGWLTLVVETSFRVRFSTAPSGQSEVSCAHNQ